MINFSILELLDIRCVLKSKVIENGKYLKQTKTKVVIDTLEESNDKYEKLIKKIDSYIEK